MVYWSLCCGCRWWCRKWMPCTHLKWAFFHIRIQQVSVRQVDNAVIMAETIVSIHVITDSSSVWGMLHNQRTEQRIAPWACMSLQLPITEITLHLSWHRPISPTHWCLTDLYGQWVNFLAKINYNIGSACWCNSEPSLSVWILFHSFQDFLQSCAKYRFKYSIVSYIHSRSHTFISLIACSTWSI